MPITIGGISINEISGPVSISYIKPTEKIIQYLQLDCSPILFLGDDHDGIEECCTYESGTIINKENSSINISCLDPLFYRIIDSIGSKNGNIDFYIEDWYAPKFLNELETEIETGQNIPNTLFLNHSNIMTYIPTYHFECFATNQTLQKRCFTNFIRYHYVDTRNTDFTLFKHYAIKNNIPIDRLNEPLSFYHINKIDKKNNKIDFNQQEILNYINHIKNHQKTILLLSEKERLTHQHNFEMKKQYPKSKFNLAYISNRPSLSLDIETIKKKCRQDYLNYQKHNPIIDSLKTDQIFISWETLLHRSLSDYIINDQYKTFFGYQTEDLLHLFLCSKNEFIDFIFDFSNIYFQTYSLLYKQINHLYNDQNLPNAKPPEHFRSLLLDYFSYYYEKYDFLIYNSQEKCHDYLFHPGINTMIHSYNQKDTLDSCQEFVIKSLCPLLDCYFLFRCFKTYDIPSILKILHCGYIHLKTISSFLIDKKYFIEHCFEETYIENNTLNTKEIKPYMKYRCLQLDKCNINIDDDILTYRSNKVLAYRRIYYFTLPIYIKCLKGMECTEDDIIKICKQFKLTKQELIKKCNLQVRNKNFYFINKLQPKLTHTEGRREE